MASEQTFGSRTILANCSFGWIAAGDAGATQEGVSYYYYVTTISQDDTYMRDCLQLGHWWAMSKENPAYREERHEADRRRIDRDLRDLRR